MKGTTKIICEAVNVTASEHLNERQLESVFAKRFILRMGRVQQCSQPQSWVCASRTCRVTEHKIKYEYIWNGFPLWTFLTKVAGSNSDKIAHYGPGINSASDRKEYQESSWAAKSSRGVKIKPYSHLWADYLANVGASTSQCPMGHHGPLQGLPYLFAFFYLYVLHRLL
jgi:hypothetical protein